MDIQQEINNHLKWIETVVSLVGKEDHTQKDLEEVTQHDHCSLGQWLSSKDALKVSNVVELEQLKEDHEAFHNLAGDLISALEAGREDEAMEAQELFIEMSQKVIGHLAVLQETSSGNDDKSSSIDP